MLKKRAADGDPIPYAAKMQMAQEVAQGMAHLTSRHFIHRDLAARNILLADGKSAALRGLGLGLVCKVADFGLSRGCGSGDGDDASGQRRESVSEDYYKSSSGVFPVRWTAPESMETLRFTTASDIWSFGIVVVEMVQDGNSPYFGTSNPDAMKYVLSRGRHS